MKSKYMIIVSFDAVSSEDIKFLSTLPNFKYLINNGSFIENVKSVYPSLTYPAHTTIVTGKRPSRHGVIDNTFFKAGDFSPNWYWYRRYIKGETIYDLAKEKGLKTCSLLWPVTAKANINYNLPEIFPTKPYHNQIIQSALGGSLFYQLTLNKKFGHIRRGISQPYLDNFVMECFKYTVDNYKPELMLVHLTDTDTNKHLHGIDSDEVKKSLIRHDKRLGEIFKILKDNNMYEDTDIIALGDHSQRNVKKIIKLNVYLKENNYIKVVKDKVKDYKAYAKSLDGACYIYVKDKSIEQQLLNELKNLNLPVSYIKHTKDVKDRNVDLNASFIIDANEGYYFMDDIKGELIENIVDKEVGKIPHKYKAVHGYNPDCPDYNTFFIGYGKDFKKAVKIDKGDLINHGPTIAKILGIDLINCDGHVIEDIIAK